MSEGCRPHPDGPVKGGYMLGGRFIRNYKGSSRPPNVPPEEWKRGGPAKKNMAIEQWEALLKIGVPTGPGSSAPALLLDMVIVATATGDATRFELRAALVARVAAAG